MYKRQHPISILFEIKLLNLAPALIVMISAEERVSFRYLIPLGFIVFAIITTFISWYYKVYWVENNVLHIKEGIFTKKESYLNKERVQTIHTKSHILYQLFGLTSVEIETAGGVGGAEVQLAGITREEATQLIAMLNKKENDRNDENQQDIPSTETPERKAMVYTLTWKEIVLASITSGKFGILFSILLVIGDKVYEYIPERIIQTAEKYVMDNDVATWIYMAIVFFFLSWIISTIQYALQHANFTISRTGDEIRISQGLLEKKELVLKIHRIQGVKIKEGLLREPFKYCSVHVEVIQSLEKGEIDVTLHPLIKKKHVQEMLQYLQLPYDIESNVIRLPKTAMKRHLFDNVVFACLLAVPIIGASIYFEQYIALTALLPIFLFSMWLGYAQYTAGGYHLGHDQLMMEYRKVAKYTVFVKRRHIQSLEKHQSYFQKNDMLCTYRFHNASARHGLEHMRMESGASIQDWYKKKDKEKL